MKTLFQSAYYFSLTFLLFSVVNFAYSNNEHGANSANDNSEVKSVPASQQPVVPPLSENQLGNLDQVSQLAVDDRLMSAINSLNSNTAPSELELTQWDITIKQLDSTAASFNAAEQYLHLLAQALLKKALYLKHKSLNKAQETDEVIAQQIVDLLTQAKSVADNIPEPQLLQPLFLQLHLLLAKQHAVLGQFELAYQEKKSYLIKYGDYRYNNRQTMLAVLASEYDINDKVDKNKSLAEQNKQQLLRINEMQQNKQVQQNNFILILVVSVIFLVFFFRQLKVRKKLIKLARTDVLTGLANRTALFEFGHAMANNFAEQQFDLSVLLLDLDNFKEINDTYGHYVGDQALKEVALLANETMRTRDMFARLGGEEFVAVLPFADSSKAKAIAQRINEKVASHDFSVIGIEEAVTLSIGVATMDFNNVTFEAVLHSADLAMYQAKEQGKNQVLTYLSISAEQERRGN